MATTRISKKSLAAFPSEISESIKALASRYGFKSFTYVEKCQGQKYVFGEGNRVICFLNGASVNVEIVAEHTLGASGVHHAINSEIMPVAGTTLLEVSYLGSYYLTVINWGSAQIESATEAA